MIRALLFDLDDTLYGYAPGNAAGLAAAHGVLDDAIGVPAERFHEVHDRVRLELARRLRGQAASHNRVLFFKEIVTELAGPRRSALACEMFDRYWSAFFDGMRPAEAAHEVLAELSADYPLALVSNHTTDIQLRKVVRLGFDRYFSAIVTSEEMGVEKPAPIVFQTALDRLGTKVGEAVMIGDDPKRDIGGAQAVGLRAILSTEFVTRDPNGVVPDGAIKDLRDLPGVIRGPR